LQKFTYYLNGLTVSEIEIPVAATMLEPDSCVKKMKIELQQQLYHEPRYARVQPIAGEL
jgi:hypothetical protein